MDGPNIEGGGQRQRQPEMLTGKFLRNAWYVAAWSEEITADKPVARTLLGEPIVMFRHADGSVAALEDRCPHRFAPLSLGKVLDGNRLQCPYHGIEIGSDGHCVHNPHGTKNIPSRARVTAYPVVEQHLAVWIWMGDKPADPRRIPDFSVLDDAPAQHLTRPNRIVVAANYELIVDNLLDDTHTCYVHAGLLGNQDTAATELPVVLDGDDVIVERIAHNAAPPGMFALLWPDSPDKVDKFSRFRWMAPCYLRLYTGICAPGAAQNSGTGYHGIHMITPQDERSTHYFFTAVRWNVKTDPATDAHVISEVARLRRFAFEEQDGPMIEAQQRIIDTASRRLEPVLLSTDAGPVRYKRVLEKLLAAEAAGG